MKSRSFRHLAWWLAPLVGGLCAFAGCYEPRGCSTDGDCFAGEVCSSEGICVTGGGDGGDGHLPRDTEVDGSADAADDTAVGDSATPPRDGGGSDTGVRDTGDRDTDGPAADADDGGGGSRRFEGVALGKRHSCGEYEDGSVVCWGEPKEMHDNIPDSQFAETSGGDDLHCGKMASGDVVCWAPDDYGYDEWLATLPSSVGEGGHIELGDGVTEDTIAPPLACFYDASGYEIDCRARRGETDEGDTNDFRFTFEPGASVYDLAVGRHYACVATSAGVECGTSQHIDNRDKPPEMDGSLNDADVRHIDCARKHCCTIDADGGMACFGQEAGAEPPTTETTYDQVVTGLDFTCARKKESRRVECWGESDRSEVIDEDHVFDGPVEAMSAGNKHVCIVTAEPAGYIRCWGRDEHGNTNPPAP